MNIDEPRIAYYKVAPEGIKHLQALERYLANCVTRISETHVPEAAFQAAREHFNETELVNLTLAITAINSWNRIAISFRSVPGTYAPRSVAAV